jgi:hypothetical protein
VTDLIFVTNKRNKPLSRVPRQCDISHIVQHRRLTADKSCENPNTAKSKQNVLLNLFQFHVVNYRWISVVMSNSQRPLTHKTLLGGGFAWMKPSWRLQQRPNTEKARAIGRDRHVVKLHASKVVLVQDLEDI